MIVKVLMKVSRPRFLLIISSFLIAILVAGLGLFVRQNRSKSPSSISPPSESSTPSPPTFFPPPSEKVFNLLLLGQGDPSHEGSNLTDALLVIHLNTENKRLALISLPRDIWIGEQKINQAYSTGGFASVKQAAGTVTGLPVNYAILIDFNGFAQAIDILGGIEVNVPKTFDDYFYPIRGKELETCGKSAEEIASLTATMSGFQLEKQFICRYEHIRFEAGKNQMNGATTLKFVRSRHSDQHGGDFARGQRQQAVLLGIKDKLISLDVLDKIPSFFDKLIRLVNTDLDKEGTIAIANLITDREEYKTTQINLSEENVLGASKSQNGQFILLPKTGPDQWWEIQQFIQKQIGQPKNVPENL